MRYFKTFIFVLILFESFGQISVSAGMNRRIEGGRGSLFSSIDSKRFRFINDYYNLKCDYQDKWWMISGEVGLLSKKGIEYETSYSIQTGSSSSNYYHYNANVDFTYLSLKIFPSYLFEGAGLVFKKTKSGIGGGLFFQTDFLIFHKEENNHSIYSPENYVYVSEPVFFSFGFRIFKRITFKNLFIEGNGAVGFSTDSRTTFKKDVSYRDYSKLLYELGFSLGYTIQLKKEKTIEQE